MKSLLRAIGGLLGGLLKRAANPAFDALKAKVISQFDWAIGKVKEGEAADLVVRTLRTQLGNILPPGTSILVDLALQSLDWEALAKKPAADVIRELERIKEQVKVARL